MDRMPFTGDKVVWCNTTRKSTGIIYFNTVAEDGNLVVLREKNVAIYEICNNATTLIIS